MTILELVLFIIGLITPFLYQRIKFKVDRPSFYKIELRRKTRLNIHHGHWGFILNALSVYMFIFGWKNWFSVGLAGLALGLMLDEIIPLLKMPANDRELELKVYEESFKGTLCIIIGAAVTVFLIYMPNFFPIH